MGRTIDLYRWTGSPPCQVVMMVAQMLTIDLNLIEVDILIEEQMKPEFLKINRYHTVPTILDDGFALWESRTIITYLVDKYASDDTLYPKDLALRARVNQRLLFDAELYERFGDYYYPPFEGKRGNVERLRKAVANVEILEQDLADEMYAVGEKLTVADIALVVTISVAETLGYDLSKHPNVSAWFTRCKKEIKGYQEINQHGLDILKKLIPKNEEHVEL